MNKNEIEELKPGDLVIRVPSKDIYEVAAESELSPVENTVLFRYITYYPANIDFKKFSAISHSLLLRDDMQVMRYRESNYE